MSTPKQRRQCRHPHCTTQTKARNQLCPSHRPVVVVVAHSGRIQISTNDTLITYAAALRLADDLVDAVERSQS